jgi:DNA-directed RNA polymerase specialized sigma24 family protein
MNNQSLTTRRVKRGRSRIEILLELEKRDINQKFFQLDEPYFTPVVLHCCYEWSYGKIAYRLGYPVGTIKSQVSRGIKKLASCSQVREA